MFSSATWLIFNQSPCLYQLSDTGPWRSGCDSKNGIFNLVLLIGIFRSSHDNALRWMPKDLTDDTSTLVQVMAWCRQATSHYLSQCWLSSLSPYGIARPQWVKKGLCDNGMDVYQPHKIPEVKRTAKRQSRVSIKIPQYSVKPPKLYIPRQKLWQTWVFISARCLAPGKRKNFIKPKVYIYVFHFVNKIHGCFILTLCRLQVREEVVNLLQ